MNITISALGEAASRIELVQTDLPTEHLAEVAAGWHTHLDAIEDAVLDKRTAFDARRDAAYYHRYMAAFRASQDS